MPAGVSVVVCGYTLARWDDIVAACHSLGRQSRPPDEIVLVIDHSEELLARARDELRHVTVVANAGRKGLSDARNTGIQVSRGELVLFLDDDATADRDWVANLAAAFDDPSVIGVGAWARPRWDPPGRPRWFPTPFLWVVGCSYDGLPAAGAQIRNPIGCAMGFRRRSLQLVDGFSTAVGRVDQHPVGCEETELSIRLARSNPGGRIVHVPSAIVTHRVTPDRRRVRYFVRRCFWEGYSKARVAESVGSDVALSAERAYATRVLPRAALQGLRDAVTRGDLGGAMRSGAIVLGLGATTSGFTYGLLSRATRPVVRKRGTPTDHEDAAREQHGVGAVPDHRTSLEAAS